MRLEKLPDEGHDKVIWSRERSRDGTGDKASRQRYFETWWRRNTATLLGVSFGRRRWDVLMGWSGYWDVLVTYHRDVNGCFIWDLSETLWRRTDGTSSLRPHETSSWHTKKTSWRRTTETSWWCSTDTSLGASFETFLRRHWDVQRDVDTTSPRRCVAGCADSYQ